MASSNPGILSDPEAAGSDALECVAGGFASLTDAGKFLSVSRSTLYELMQSGELPRAKLGAKSVRIPWAALRAYAAKCLSA